MILTTTDVIQDAIVQSYLRIVTAEFLCGNDIFHFNQLLRTANI